MVQIGPLVKKILKKCPALFPRIAIDHSVSGSHLEIQLENLQKQELWSITRLYEYVPLTMLSAYQDCTFFISLQYSKPTGLSLCKGRLPQKESCLLSFKRALKWHETVFFFLQVYWRNSSVCFPWWRFPNNWRKVKIFCTQVKMHIKKKIILHLI